MAGEIEIKVGEGKWITFNITRSNVAVDVSSASFVFAIKSDVDDVSYLLAKSGESDFDKSQGASGVVRVNVTATETTALGVGTFVSELQTIFTVDEDEDKSDIIPFIVKESVIHT